eukprot:jgi/Botrbrau1/20780/Bobra.0156s0011.2
MFVEVYGAAMRHMRLGGAWASTGFLADVTIDAARLARPWVSSLGAFWPGMQVLAGQVGDAKALHGNWTLAWTRFAGLPELFDVSITQRHPIQRGYPLRPELMESTYLLYSATQSPVYLQVGRLLQATLVEHTSATCGYASIADVATREKEDTMESFFLSETCKYLYMLFAETADLPDFFVFSTEGHLLPPVPLSDRQSAGKPSDAAPLEPDVAMEGTTEVGDPAADPWDHFVVPRVPGVLRELVEDVVCGSLCKEWTEEEAGEAARRVQAELPLIGVDVRDSRIIRWRRCQACIAVTLKMVDVQQARTASGHKADEQQAGGSPADAGALGTPQTVSGHQGTPSGTETEAPGPIIQQLVCQMQVGASGNLECARMDALPVTSSLEGIKGLPPSSVVLQLRAVGDLPPGLAVEEVPRGNNYLRLHVHAEGPKGEALVELEIAGTGATFGATLGVSPACAEAPDPDSDFAISSGCLVRGPVTVASPVTACSQLDNPEHVRGSLVIVQRGGCMFIEKVGNVARAGGLAAVVISDGEEVMLMSGVGPAGEPSGHPDPGIPSVLLPKSQGNLLMGALSQEREDVRLSASLLPVSPEEEERLGVVGMCPAEEAVTTETVALSPSPEPDPWTHAAQAEAKAWAAGLEGAPLSPAGDQGQFGASPSLIQTRVEIFLPPQTHGWLQAVAGSLGKAPLVLLASLLSSLGSMGAAAPGQEGTPSPYSNMPDQGAYGACHVPPSGSHDLPHEVMPPEISGARVGYPHPEPGPSSTAEPADSAGGTAGSKGFFNIGDMLHAMPKAIRFEMDPQPPEAAQSRPQSPEAGQGSPQSP